MMPYLYLLNGAPTFQPPGGGGNWTVNNLTVTGNETVGSNLTVSGGQIQMGGTNPYIQGTTGTGYIQFQNAGDVVLASNSGALIFASNGSTQGKLATSGNYLLGTTTDSGNGKLQLATHTTSAGGIGFGTDTSLYRQQNSQLALDGTGGLSLLQFRTSGTYNGRIGHDGTNLEVRSVSGSVLLISNNTTALTLDSSQNATFAGTATVTKCLAAGSAAITSTRFGFYFGGTLSGSTDQLAIVSAPTFDSSATALAASGYFAPATANSSFTASNVYGLYVASTVKGAASTITTNYGLRIFDQTAGGTNYAIYTGSGLVRFGDAVTVTGAIAIGNTVNTVSPTSPNRTITMVIGGTTYYIAAKTTND